MVSVRDRRLQYQHFTSLNSLDEKLNFLIQDNYMADHVPCKFPETYHLS